MRLLITTLLLTCLGSTGAAAQDSAANDIVNTETPAGQFCHSLEWCSVWEKKTDPAACFYPEGSAEDPFLLLEKMLDDAEAQGTRVLLHFPPCHANNLELYRIFELWDAYWEFKERVARLALGREKVRLFDFQIYGARTQQAVISDLRFAEPQGTERPHSFTDVMHFTPDLGDVILQQMLGESSVDPGLGYLVSSVERLQQEKEKQWVRSEDYRRKHPVEFELVKEISSRGTVSPDELQEVLQQRIRRIEARLAKDGES